MPKAGTAAAAAGAGPAATIGIFFISGLLLQKGESLAALRSTAAVAYGLITVLLVTPLLALGIVRLPLQPPEVALGLAIFCCMPTTLSANVMLTTVSGGNTAVALLLTIASNTLAVRAAGCACACAGQWVASRVPAAGRAWPAGLHMLLNTGRPVAAAHRASSFNLLPPTTCLPRRCSPSRSCCPWCWAAQQG